MKLYKAAHTVYTVYKTQYHIVWISRYRRKILVTGIKSYLKIKFQEIRKYYPDWEYIEIYRDRNKERSCSLVYGNPTKVCRKQSSGNHQKEYQQISKQEVCFLEKSILGQKRYLG